MGGGGGSQPLARPGVVPAFCQLLREAWGPEPGEAEGPEGETVARSLAWFESMKSLPRLGQADRPKYPVLLWGREPPLAACGRWRLLVCWAAEGHLGSY